jgi:hypothetical protein
VVEDRGPGCELFRLTWVPAYLGPRPFCVTGVSGRGSDGRQDRRHRIRLAQSPASVCNNSAVDFLFKHETQVFVFSFARLLPRPMRQLVQQLHADDMHRVAVMRLPQILVIFVIQNVALAGL